MAEYPILSEASPNSKKRARTASDASIPTPSLLQTEWKRTSKRLRTNSSNAPDNHEIQSIPVPEVVVFERRRVNPESLALRLGPELVRDLDALILPGNRDMPSFAVRKELQERYDIDRRHIYDYYHSKGLRVVKEDRNGNPIRQTVQSMVSPQPTLRLLRQAPPKVSLHLHGPSTKHNPPKPLPKPKPSKQHGNRSGKPKNIQKSPPKPTLSRKRPKGPQAHSSYPEAQQSSSQALPVSSVPFVSSHYFSKPVQLYSPFDIEDELHFSFPENFQDSSVTKMQATSDDTFFSNQSKPVFERMMDYQHSEASLPYSFTEKPESLTSMQKSTTHTDRQPLTKEERREFYNFLDGVLGPASGVQESVGTYKAYMAEQSRLYFERLLPGSHQHMRKVQAQTYVRSQTISQAEVPAEGSVNFRKWLASDDFEHSSLGIQQSSNIPYLSDGTRLLVADSILYRRLSENSGRISSNGFTSAGPPSSYDSEDGFGSTLDDLFPDWQENSVFEDAIIGSPVLRSSVSYLAQDSESRTEHVIAQQDTISPTSHLDSQQTSPDIASSPFVQTPDTTHQQCTQRKNNDFTCQSPSVTLQNIAYHSDPDSQHPPALDPDLLFRYGIGLDGAEFRDVSTRFDTSSLTKFSEPTGSSNSIEITKITARRVNRLRTTSAGGGI